MKKVFKNLFLGLMAAGVVFAGCKLDETDDSALMAAAAAASAGSGSSASVVQTKTITGISISNETTTVKTGTSKVSIGIKCKYSDNTWSELSEDEISELTSDDTLIISIEDADADGNGVDCTSKIKSGNKLIPGTVEGEIQVKALYEKNGSKFVSKKTFTISASAVVEKSLDSVELTGLSSPVKLSSSPVALAAKAHFTDSTEEDITSSATFTSSDSTVAEVSGTTLVLKKAGKTTVKVSYTYGGVEKTASIELTVQDNDVTLASIEFGTTASEVAYGSSVELFVNATYSNGTVSKVTGNVTYALSTSSYAAIDGSTLSNKNTSTGDVDVTVTATYEGKTATKTFTLKKQTVATLSSIEFTNTNYVVANGGSVELAVKAVYDDGSKEDVTPVYSLSDSTNAAISGTTLTNKNTTSAAVTVTVTATYNGKTAVKEFTLQGTSSPVVNAIKFTKETVEIVKGSTEKLSVKAVYSDGSSVDVTPTYQTSSSAVATVAADGTVTAVAVGTATITANYGAYSATCTVKVTDKQLKSIAITATPTSIACNGTSKLKVTATYEDDTTADVTADATITSGNTSVLTISKSGSSATATANNTATSAVGVVVTATFASTASPLTSSVTVTVAGKTTEPGSGTIGFDFN
jgi:hypothetical protein